MFNCWRELVPSPAWRHKYIVLVSGGEQMERIFQSNFLVSTATPLDGFGGMGQAPISCFFR